MNPTETYKASQQKFYAKEGVEPQSKFLTISGPVKKVHYLEVGEGQPLILLHGGGGNTDQWVNLIKHLEKDFRLIIVDRPGCGLTDPINYRGVDYRSHCVDFILGVMNALGLKQADFAANSMGGYWTALFAMKNPEKVGKIVFLGAPAGLDMKLPFFLKLLGVRGLNDFLWATMAKPSLKGTRKLYEMLLVADASRLSDEYIEVGYRGSILPAYKTGWLTLLETISTMSGFRKDLFIGKEIGQLSVPSLFLWGDKDAFQSPAEGKDVVKSVANHQFTIVPDAGHLPWLDQPVFCSTRIKEFLAEKVAH